MKIVARDLDLVPVSSIGPGSTFRWGTKYYIKTCCPLCERGIWGVGLREGSYISGGDTLVELVDMEARVL
jgi:hypothetical protein